MRPSRVEPQLATQVPDPPDGKHTKEAWLHEIKFDGYRTMAHVRGRRGAADHARRARLDETLRRPSARFRQAAVQRGDHRRRGRRARRKGHQPLRPAPGRAVGRRRQQARLLRLRSRPSRRLGSAGKCRSSNARRCSRNCSPAMRPAVRRSSSATMSKATATRSTNAHPSSAWRASSPSALPPPTRAAAPRPGPRRRRSRSAISSSPATRRRRRQKGSPRWRSASGRTANCTTAARSVQASTAPCCTRCSRGSNRCAPEPPHSTARQRTSSGSGRCSPPTSTIRTGHPTICFGIPCSRASGTWNSRPPQPASASG